MIDVSREKACDVTVQMGWMSLDVKREFFYILIDVSREKAWHDRLWSRETYTIYESDVIDVQLRLCN